MPVAYSLTGNGSARVCSADESSSQPSINSPFMMRFVVGSSSIGVSETIVPRPVAWPRLAAVLTAAAIVVLPVFAGRLLSGGDDPQALRPHGDLVTAPYPENVDVTE